MKLSEANREMNQIPEGQREAILNIIELKTEENMKEVIQRIDKFETITQSNFKHFENNFRLMYWLLGIIGGAIVLGVTVYLALYAK